MSNKEFKEELRELLDKWNASIEFDCSGCSDLHGVYNAAIAIKNGKAVLVRVNGYNRGKWDL